MLRRIEILMVRTDAMLETRAVTTRCDKCETINNIPLNYFLSFGYKFKKSVISNCICCNKDFVVTFDDSSIC